MVVSYPVDAGTWNWVLSRTPNIHNQWVIFPAPRIVSLCLCIKNSAMVLYNQLCQIFSLLTNRFQSFVPNVFFCLLTDSNQFCQICSLFMRLFMRLYEFCLSDYHVICKINCLLMSLFKIILFWILVYSGLPLCLLRVGL